MAKDRYKTDASRKRYWASKHTWLKSPRGKYSQQRKKAVKRGIPWRFRFETWWEMWQASGKWAERGRLPGQFVMCRKGDRGPYSSDNCFIAEGQWNLFFGRHARRKK